MLSIVVLEPSVHLISQPGLWHAFGVVTAAIAFGLALVSARQRGRHVVMVNT